MSGLDRINKYLREKGTGKNPVFAAVDYLTPFLSDDDRLKVREISRYSARLGDHVSRCCFNQKALSDYKIFLPDYEHGPESHLDAANVALAIGMLARACFLNFSSNFKGTQGSEHLIESPINQWLLSVIERWQKIWQEDKNAEGAAVKALAAREEEESRAQQAQDARAASERQTQLDRAMQYFCCFRRVPLNPEDETRISRMESASVRSAEQEGKAAVCAVIESIRSNCLDGRGHRTEPDPKRPTATLDLNVQEFAHLLFSKTNLSFSLLARGVSLQPFSLLKPTYSPDSTSRERLAKLWDYEAVRAVIRAIGQDSSGVALLGTLALPLPQVITYLRDSKPSQRREDFFDAIVAAIRAEKQVAPVRLRLLPRDEVQQELGIVDVTTLLSRLGLQSDVWLVESCNGGALLTMKDQPTPVGVVITKRQLKEQDNVLRKTFQKKLHEALLDAEVERGLNELEESGLVVERDGTGMPLRVCHPACAIETTITKPIGNFLPTFQRIRSHIEAHEADLDALSSALPTGFSLSRDDTSTHLVYPTGRREEISNTAYVSLEQSERVLALCKEYVGKAELEKRQEEKRMRKELDLRARNTRSVTPTRYDQVIIPDTNALFRLCATVSKEGDRTFLNVLQQVTQLSHLRLFISRIVYAEATGEVLRFQGDDRVNQIERTQLVRFSSPTSTPLERFFKDACHVQVNEQGQVSRVATGPNVNLCIVHCEGKEEALVDELLTAISHHERGVDVFNRKFKGKGLGDAAITDLISRLPAVSGVTVVTSDRRYADNDMPKFCHGAPVLAPDLYQFLAAVSHSIDVSELAPNRSQESGFAAHAAEVINDWMSSHLSSSSNGTLQTLALGQRGGNGVIPALMNRLSIKEKE